MAKANWGVVTKVSNQASKADHSELLTQEQESNKWDQIVQAEVAAGSSRDPNDIGPVGYLASYEFIALNIEIMVEMAKQARSIMEMLFKLHSPNKTLFAIGASSFNYNFIESLNTNELYVLNDEHLFRGENYFLQAETKATVIDSLDFFNGTMPSGLDCVCLSAADIFCASNENLVSQVFSNLNVGGTLIVYDANDGMQMYAEKLQTYGWQVHKKLLELSGASVYHIPTPTSFTVVVKNS